MSRRCAARNCRTPVKTRLETLRHDLASLNDYEAHLLNKVQLLLDATLGLINVEQNDIIKVLTVVSVVGVPPTLVASMYGMNFKYMPELDWAWGYPYGAGDDRDQRDRAADLVQVARLVLTPRLLRQRKTPPETGGVSLSSACERSGRVRPPSARS